jgi:hypothetical protein
MLAAALVFAAAQAAMAADGPATLVPAGSDNAKAPTSSADGEKVVVDQSSAKAALETIAKAFKAHDGAAMAACLPPEYKDTMGPMFLSAMDMIAKAESLRKTIEAKFGKEIADAALKGSPAEGAVKNGPFAGCLKNDGTIDWDRATLIEEGDTATFQVKGKDHKDTLTKLNGKWCMALEGMTPEKAKAQGAGIRKMMKVMGDAFTSLEQQIKDGKIGKDDLEQALKDTMTKALNEALQNARQNAPPPAPPQ